MNNARRHEQDSAEPRRPRPGGRRPKKHEEEEHENHERWLVSYADMMTLLMVLFIVMFAISQVDLNKFAAFSQGLQEGFGAPVTILNDGAAVDAPTDVDSPLKPVQVAEEAAIDGSEQTAAEQAAAEAGSTSTTRSVRRRATASRSSSSRATRSSSRGSATGWS